MMPDPGCGVSSEAKRFRCRLRWALVLGTLLVLGINSGVQAPHLSRGSDFKGGSGGLPEICSACSAMSIILN